jgi:peptidoglycan hydrolase CwlO-like protein
LEETSQRLSAQASMYESMINSLKSTDTSNSVLMNKLHASERQAYEEEIAELKEYRRKLQEDMNNKEHEHLRATNDREQAVKEM